MFYRKEIFSKIPQTMIAKALFLMKTTQNIAYVQLEVTLIVL